MSDLSSVRQEEGRSLTRFLCLQTRLEDAPQAPVVGGGERRLPHQIIPRTAGWPQRSVTTDDTCRGHGLYAGSPLQGSDSQ